jgi:hypothetical protein
MACTVDDVIIGRSTQVINVIQEMEEVTYDTGQKISVDRTKYMNISK